MFNNGVTVCSYHSIPTKFSIKPDVLHQHRPWEAWRRSAHHHQRWGWLGPCSMWALCIMAVCSLSQNTSSRYWLWFWGLLMVDVSESLSWLGMMKLCYISALFIILWIFSGCCKFDVIDNPFHVVQQAYRETPALEGTTFVVRVCCNVGIAWCFCCWMSKD